MSTVAVVVVVVGACIGVVVSYATRWLEDATDEGSPERGRHAARPEAPDRAVVDVVEPVDEPAISGTTVAESETLLPENDAPAVEADAPSGRRPTVRERRQALVEAAAEAEAPTPPRRNRPDAAPVVVVEPALSLPADAVVSDRLVAGPVAQRVEPVQWWERFRSAMALTAVSVVLGIIAAAVIGVALVALFSLLRSAVG